MEIESYLKEAVRRIIDKFLPLNRFFYKNTPFFYSFSFILITTQIQT